MTWTARTVVGATLVMGAALLTRRLTQTWGTRDDEHVAPLPGDDLVRGADVVATRALTIEARPSAVWPWVVQLGHGRGGFYSYDLLEHLAGLDIHSADQVQERWQGLGVGDEVHLAPDVALRVAALEPASHLVLLGARDALRAPGAELPPEMPFDFSWAFVLRTLPDGATRLLVRERYRSLRWWSRLVVEPVQPISFLMSQKMLRGIRQRAESTAQLSDSA